MKRYLCLGVWVCSLLLSVSVAAIEPFKVQAIQIKGLTHTAQATVLNYTPVKRGDQLTTEKADEVVHALYKTGFFSQVQLHRKGGTLIIAVQERPVISHIAIEGNDEVKKEQVETLLEKIGLVVGQPYQKNLIKLTETALQKNYVGLGLYGAKVHVDAEVRKDQRVDITIHIQEGAIASIKQIRIIGNHHFKEKKLLRVFTMETSHIWSPIFHDDRYSPEKMHADLEALRSFYFDHGYLNFEILSSQVALSPDGEGVYVVIRIKEGEAFTINRLILKGQLPSTLSHAYLKKMLTAAQGQVFSRKALGEDIAHIKEALANRGYAFAEVEVGSKLNQANHTVDVTLTVAPGHLIYVRNVTFNGNTLTADTVLRRASRQYEGARFSYHALKESERRLKNLGYVSNVTSKVEPVPGHPDQVDLAFGLEEKSSAQFNFQVGYSQAFGLLYGVNWQQPNALGSGNDFMIALNRSQYQSSANISYFDPYFTKTGISQDVGVSFQKTTPQKVDLSDYRMDTASAYLHYGIPLTEYQSVGIGVSLDQVSLHTNENSPSQVANFVSANGDDFRQLGINASWGYSNLDQSDFPNKGWVHRLGLSVSNSIGDHALHFFTTNYHLAWYTPMPRSTWVIHARADARYGDGFDTTDNLPFYRNFYTGGIGSVAGYEPNGLGPKDSNGRPLGGNVSVDGALNVVIPTSLSEKARIYVFTDVGNVYQDQLDLGQLRYSVGVGVLWKTLIPMQFAIAKAINPGSSDETRLFDFNIGMHF